MTYAVGKKEFIQLTSKYLKQIEIEGELIITHHGKPALKLVPIRENSIVDLKGLNPDLKVRGDIHDPVLLELV